MFEVSTFKFLLWFEYNLQRLLSTIAAFVTEHITGDSDRLSKVPIHNWKEEHWLQSVEI